MKIKTCCLGILSKKSFFLIAIGVIFGGLLTSLLWIYKIKYNPSGLVEITQLQEQIKVLKEKSESTDEEIKQDNRKIEEQRTLEGFLDNYLKKYPKFQSEVKPETIKRAFSFKFDEIDSQNQINQQKGWLVEVEKTPEHFSYYLLTSTLEKELLNPMSCVVGDDENLPTKIEKMDIVSVYIVLSGTEDGCYGGADFGFISVYKISTGEKIKLQGDFTAPGTYGKVVSKTGNALGRLKGIYGFKQPTLVVEYLPSYGYERGMFAYFDPQTGALKQLIELE